MTANVAMDAMKGQYKMLTPTPNFDRDKVVILRHAETIEEVFPDWIQKCCLDSSFYLPFDLNVPVHIPRRPNTKIAYQHDPPLSEIGKITSQIVARELLVRKATPSAIFCSPDLASLQTAYEIQNFLGNTKCGLISIEPALSTKKDTSNFWIPTEYLKKLKYNIDANYTALKTEIVDTDLNVSTTNIIRALKIMARRKGVVLIITDALAVKIMSDFGDGSYKIKNEIIEKDRTVAEAIFPPISSVVLSTDSEHEKILLQPADLFLRPMSTVGFRSITNMHLNGSIESK